MAIGQRLEFRQSQTLAMTPQLQQAIKLLQLSNIEVAAYVEAELERNPLLERSDANGEAVDGAEAAGGDEPGAPEPAAMNGEASLLDPVIEPSSAEPSAASEAPLDTDFENVWSSEDAQQSGATPWGNGGRSDFAGNDYDLEETLTREISLRDHLIEQISIDIEDPVDRMIGFHLVDSLDEAGYFVGDAGQIAATLQCERERVEHCILRLQELDPAGVFARDLKECLALQLRERDRLDPAMAVLLDNLPLLARRDLGGLMRLCSVTGDDLTDMVAEIKALNPKPGQSFDRTTVQAIVPDVLMRPAPDGSWHVELNQDTLPRVLVNERYYARVTQQARTRQDKSFLSERFQSANWLVKSLHQRAQTILKVASEIVRQQDAFFRKGVRYLRPLILRDIAAAIEMHESTVSRVTTNKYLAAPQGMYELKYFFSSAIASASGGDSHSAESVRFRIKALIEREGGGALSDDKLVELLRRDGINIARRTVAKYRGSLRISSSVQRRREKVLGL
jgi:RNA polymerase sigma-54 factor